MSHVTNTLQRTKLQQFAEKEFAGSPLTHHTHVRVPARLKSFIGSIALVDEVGMSTEALRKWRHHPDSQPFLERVVTENLVCAKNTAISKARKMIDICVQIAEDPKTKPYSRIAAANTVLDKALKFDENDFMRKELAKVRELLEDSEAGRSTQIIDVSD